jgi:hypothetical protein
VGDVVESGIFGILANVAAMFLAVSSVSLGIIHRYVAAFPERSGLEGSCV